MTYKRLFVLFSIEWRYASFTLFSCCSISLYAVPAVSWAYMQVHELACSSMTLHAAPWACMQFNELTYSIMNLLAGPWSCIQFNEITCSLTPKQPRSCIYAWMGMVRAWDVYTPGTPGMMESHIKIDTYYYHYYHYGQTGSASAQINLIRCLRAASPADTCLRVLE